MSLLRGTGRQAEGQATGGHVGFMTTPSLVTGTPRQGGSKEVQGRVGEEKAGRGGGVSSTLVVVTRCKGDREGRDRLERR